jgi:hypothetical protein
VPPSLFPLPSRLPFALLLFHFCTKAVVDEGRCWRRRDNERVSAALADDDRVHVTTRGANFDLVLRYRPEGRFLLAGLVLRQRTLTRPGRQLVECAGTNNPHFCSAIGLALPGP